MVSIATTTTAPRQSRAIGWGRFALVGLATIVAAVLANTLVYYLGRATIGYHPEFVILADVGTTIFFTTIPAIVATLLYAALLRFTRRPARTFTIIAAIVFIVTLIPDFTLIPGSPGATAGQTATLVLMHIVAATVITTLLTTLSRPSPLTPRSSSTTLPAHQCAGRYCRP
jgi:hypothetical protein